MQPGCSAYTTELSWCILWK